MNVADKERRKALQDKKNEGFKRNMLEWVANRPGVVADRDFPSHYKRFLYAAEKEGLVERRSVEGIDHWYIAGADHRLTPTFNPIY